MGGGNLGPGFIVAKLAGDGAHIWSQALGGTTGQGFDERPGIAVTPTNDVIFAASFGGTMTFDDGSLTATSSGDDIAVAKLRGTNGSTSQAAGGWARMFGAPGADVVGAVSVDIAGNILVAGRHADGTSFGSYQLQQSGMFLAKIDNNGNVAWGRSIGGAYPHAMSTTALGHIVVTGKYDDMADFGGGPLHGDPGGVFLVQLDSSGYHEWSWGVSGSSLDVHALTRDAQGDIIVIGTFRTSIDFGTGPITVTSDAPAIFILKADARGQPRWSRGFGGLINDVGYDVVATPVDDLIVTGKSSGFLDFGTGPSGDGSVSGSPFLARLGR
jgi:hypothetical protein